VGGEEFEGVGVAAREADNKGTRMKNRSIPAVLILFQEGLVAVVLVGALLLLWKSQPPSSGTAILVGLLYYAVVLPNSLVASRPKIGFESVPTETIEPTASGMLKRIFFLNALVVAYLAIVVFLWSRNVPYAGALFVLGVVGAGSAAAYVFTGGPKSQTISSDKSAEKRRKVRWYLRNAASRALAFLGWLSLFGGINLSIFGPNVLEGVLLSFGGACLLPISWSLGVGELSGSRE
jgi:hypothetical protein